MENLWDQHGTLFVSFETLSRVHGYVELRRSQFAARAAVEQPVYRRSQQQVTSIHWPSPEHAAAIGECENVSSSWRASRSRGVRRVTRESHRCEDRPRLPCTIRTTTGRYHPFLQGGFDAPAPLRTGPFLFGLMIGLRIWGGGGCGAKWRLGYALSPTRPIPKPARGSPLLTPALAGLSPVARWLPIRGGIG